MKSYCLWAVLNQPLFCAESTGHILLSHVPDLCRISLDQASLLGSPLGSNVSIDTAVEPTEEMVTIKVIRAATDSTDSACTYINIYTQLIVQLTSKLLLIGYVTTLPLCYWDLLFLNLFGNFF